VCGDDLRELSPSVTKRLSGNADSSAVSPGCFRLAFVGAQQYSGVIGDAV
jgi:hypothetical protein